MFGARPEERHTLSKPFPEHGDHSSHDDVIHDLGSLLIVLRALMRSRKSASRLLVRGSRMVKENKLPVALALAGIAATLFLNRRRLDF